MRSFTVSEPTLSEKIVSFDPDTADESERSAPMQAQLRFGEYPLVLRGEHGDALGVVLGSWLRVTYLRVR